MLVRKSLTVTVIDKLILYAKIFPALSLDVIFLSLNELIRIKMFFASEVFWADLDKLFNLE